MIIPYLMETNQRYLVVLATDGTIEVKYTRVFSLGTQRIWQWRPNVKYTSLYQWQLQTVFWLHLYCQISVQAQFTVATKLQAIDSCHHISCGNCVWTAIKFWICQFWRSLNSIYTSPNSSVFLNGASKFCGHSSLPNPGGEQIRPMLLNPAE